MTHVSVYLVHGPWCSPGNEDKHERQGFLFWKHAHLSSFLYYRVQRVVIVWRFPFTRSGGHHRGLEDSDGLDHASLWERDLNGVGGGGRVWAAGDRVCLFPDVSEREVSTFSGGDRISGHVLVNKDSARTQSRVGECPKDI